MSQKLTIPAWLLGAAIVAQLLMVFLNGHLIYKATHPSKVWALDSTTYYKFLEGQGKLNLRLYEQTQAHESRLRLLDKKRKARHQHIDSLSGDALQREIDRQYNNRQSQSGASPNPGPQTDSANRGRGTSGTQRQGRSTHAIGRSAITRYIVRSTTAGDFEPESDDSAVERTAAAGTEPGHNCPEPGRPLPEETARSQVGKLDRSGRSPALHSRQAQINLRYWRLILTQNYTYPDVAFTISAVETGYWPVRRRGDCPGNNLFGMKKNPRHFYSSLSAGGYCRYSDKNASLADYGTYEQQVITRYGLLTRSAYLAHIYRRFCPNRAYKSRLDLAFQKLVDIRLLT